MQLTTIRINYIFQFVPPLLRENTGLTKSAAKPGKRQMAARRPPSSEDCKTAVTGYRQVRLALLMNQVQINQCAIAAHRDIGIVLDQAGKCATVTRCDVGTQEFDIRAAFCTEEIGIAQRCIDG